MMRLFLQLLLIFLLLSCAPKKSEDKNIAIVIDYPQSYKFDLQRQVYTVSFVDKPDTVIKFHLLPAERNEIVNKYYDMGIDEITGMYTATQTTLIEDECMDMPKLYTILRVKTKSWQQDIQIDDGCDDFYIYNFRKAARIKAFIRFVMDILQSKPEIKNAPTSDIMYI